MALSNRKILSKRRKEMICLEFCRAVEVEVTGNSLSLSYFRIIWSVNLALETRLQPKSKGPQRYKQLNLQPSAIFSLPCTPTFLGLRKAGKKRLRLRGRLKKLLISYRSSMAALAGCRVPKCCIIVYLSPTNSPFFTQLFKNWTALGEGGGYKRWPCALL